MVASIDYLKKEIFEDEKLKIYDDIDTSKQLQFEVSGLTTGQTRVLTVPDNNGTILLEGTAVSASDITCDSITCNDITALRPIATDMNKKLVNTNMSSWISGSTNQISVSNDSDGSCTLTLPQDIDVNADVTFDTASIDTLILSSGADKQKIKLNGTVLPFIGTLADDNLSIQTTTLMEFDVNLSTIASLDLDSFNVDKINEYTSATGVTIEGILIKDSEISAANKLTVDNIILNGNEISALDANGDINLDLSGTGVSTINGDSQNFALRIKTGNAASWDCGVAAEGTNTVAVLGVINDKACVGGHSTNLGAWDDITFNQGNSANAGFFTTNPSASHGAAGVIFIGNRSTAPTGNPSGGGILYTESGALKYRGSSGTDTTLGAANPHCPVCGRDFGLEYKNKEMGYYFICMPCMIDELGFKNKPWVLDCEPQERKDDSNRTCKGETEFINGKTVKCEPTMVNETKFINRIKWADNHGGKEYAEYITNTSDKITDLSQLIESLNNNMAVLKNRINLLEGLL